VNTTLSVAAAGSSVTIAIDLNTVESSFSAPDGSRANRKLSAQILSFLFADQPRIGLVCGPQRPRTAVRRGEEHSALRVCRYGERQAFIEKNEKVCPWRCLS
jgi:hypothetical protein